MTNIQTLSRSTEHEKANEKCRASFSYTKLNFSIDRC